MMEPTCFIKIYLKVFVFAKHEGFIMCGFGCYRFKAIKFSAIIWQFRSIICIGF